MTKVLLILDIDETLLHASKELLSKDWDFKVFEFYVYLRPHLKEFIESTLENYNLALWSSAGDEYVNAIVENSFLKDYPFKFIWGSSRATYRRNYVYDELRQYSRDSNSHYHYVKPLKKVRRKGYDLKRVLIVDDSPHKSQLNYGNAIYPLPYDGGTEDLELEYLKEYLITIKDTPNFRKLEKRKWRDKYS